MDVRGRNGDGANRAQTRLRGARQRPASLLTHRRHRGWRKAVFEHLSVRNLLAAEVLTDLQDYSPGQTAVISAWNGPRDGGSFAAGERIRFQVVRTDGIPDAPPGNLPWYVTDGVGGFAGRYVDSDGDGKLDYGEFPDTDGVVNAAVGTTWYVESQYGDSTLQLSAEGLQSHAKATHDFTDRVSSLILNSPRATKQAVRNPGQQFSISYSARFTNTNSARLHRQFFRRRRLRESIRPGRSSMRSTSLNSTIWARRLVS